MLGRHNALLTIGDPIWLPCQALEKRELLCYEFFGFELSRLDAVARKPPAGKPRFGAAKKPAAKSGGLGVKKMTTKVDDSLFDQAPSEDPAPAAALSALAPSLSVSLLW